MADHVRDESETPFSNFPQDPSEFDNDPRVSFSKLDDKFILEADDGQEYEYDNALKRWILTVCEPRAYPPFARYTGLRVLVGKTSS